MQAYVAYAEAAVLLLPLRRALKEAQALLDELAPAAKVRPLPLGEVRES